MSGLSSKTVDVLISNAQKGGKAFEPVNTALAEILFLTRDSVYEPSFKRFFEHCRTLSEKHRDFICMSQAIAVQAVRFVDDLLEADFWSVLNDSNASTGEKRDRVIYYSSLVRERSESSKKSRLAKDFHSLRYEIAALPVNFTLLVDTVKKKAGADKKALDDCKSKMKNCKGSIRVWQVVACSSYILSGPTKWCVLAVGLLGTLCSMEAYKEASEEVKSKDNLKPDADFAPVPIFALLEQCEKTFTETGSEMVAFVDVWKQADTALQKLRGLLEHLQVNNTPPHSVPSGKMREMFEGLRSDLGTYSTATLIR